MSIYKLGNRRRKIILDDDFSCVGNETLFVDSTSDITISLPNSPSIGDEIILIDQTQNLDSIKLTVLSAKPVNSLKGFHTIAYSSYETKFVYSGDDKQGWFYDGSITTETTSFLDYRKIGKCNHYSLWFGIMNDGTLWKWGLGTDNVINQVPVQILHPRGKKFVELSACLYHALFLDEENKIFAIGNEQCCGISSNNTYTATNLNELNVPYISNFSQARITTSVGNSFVYEIGGPCYSWGSSTPALGIGEITEYKAASNPSSISGFSFKRVYGNYEVVFAIDNDGKIWGWGDDESSLKWAYASDSMGLPVELLIANNSNFTNIQHGSSHSMALDKSGNFWSWGLNDEGQLGIGNTTTDSEPTIRSLGINFVNIAAGAKKSAALDMNGGIWGWGFLTPTVVGRLGEESYPNTTFPNYFCPERSEKFVDIYSGNDSFGFIDEDGNLWEAGTTLGNYIFTPELDKYNDIMKMPFNINKKAETIQRICVAKNQDYIFEGLDHKFYAYGKNEFGELTPFNISNGKCKVCDPNVNAVCIVMTDDCELNILNADNEVVRCGKIVTESSTTSTTTLSNIVKISDDTKLTNILSIKPGRALDSSGRVWCWGKTNSRGELGCGNTTATNGKAVQLSGTHSFTKVGNHHALKDDGTLWGWGPNDKGQIGDGTTIDKSSPVLVSGGHTFIDFEDGPDYTIAITSENGFYLWGNMTPQTIKGISYLHSDPLIEGLSDSTAEIIPTQYMATDSTCTCVINSISCGNTHAILNATYTMVDATCTPILILSNDVDRNMNDATMTKITTSVLSSGHAGDACSLILLSGQPCAWGLYKVNDEVNINKMSLYYIGTIYEWNYPSGV